MSVFVVFTFHDNKLHEFLIHASTCQDVLCELGLLLNFDVDLCRTPG